MTGTGRGGVVRFADIAAAIPGPSGERAMTALRRGTLDVALSLPSAPNVQTPHAQDELYVVIRGAGALVWDDKRAPFSAGDILFVAAGTDHHYEQSSEDLALWRIFYGPAGGENEETGNAQ